MKTLCIFSARFALCLLAATVAWTPPAQAAMAWKWRDARGNIQYSDRPPPEGTPEKDILSRPSASHPAPVSAVSSAASAPAAAKQAENELDAKHRKAEEERRSKEKASEEQQAKVRADNCQRARTYMKTLNDGMRIARTNAAGEREVLDDRGRAEETQRTQEAIQANCN